MRGTPHNTGEVLRAALALRRRAVRALERLPRDPVGPRRAADRRPGAHEPLLAPVLSGRDRRQPRRRALHRRGRGLPQLHVRQVRRRGAAPALRRRVPGLRRAVGRRCCARSTTRRRARRGSTRTRCAELAEALGIDAERFERDRARVQRRDRAGGDVRPGGQGRAAHRGPGRAEVQLGAAARRAAVRRVPGHVRDHVHVRRPARRRRRARARPRRPPAARASTPPASWSAACSSTTTRAAPG